MGLDKFNETNSPGSNIEQQKDKSEDGDGGGSIDRDEFYKVVGSGRYCKAFETEEDWEETVRVIEEVLNEDIDTVLNLSQEKRHQILHKAIQLRGNVDKQGEVKVTKTCIICGDKFIFPTDWDFKEFKGEAVCPEHTIGEVKKAYEEINDL